LETRFNIVQNVLGFPNATDAERDIALDALRSLRTQHTEQQAEIERLKHWETYAKNVDALRWADVQRSEDEREAEKMRADSLQRLANHRQKLIDDLTHDDLWGQKYASLQLQHTKDQERIEELTTQRNVRDTSLYGTERALEEARGRIAELERVLANLGVQLTAGGSGDPAGGEVE
jgi:hypothetical protein